MRTLMIREMLPEDLKTVCRIEAENFSVPWSEKSFLESMEREDTVFLTAVFDGEVVGYLGCYCIDGVGEITNVAVDAAFRCQGVGARLLEGLYEHAPVHSCQEFFLEVRESNKAAIALYTRQGFQKEGIRKNFYERPREHALILWKHDSGTNYH